MTVCIATPRVLTSELLQWLILLCCEISQDQPFPEQENGFQAVIKLEGINHQHPSLFCVLSVAEVRDDVTVWLIAMTEENFLENDEFQCFVL